MRTRIRRIWQGIKQRCHNPNDKRYPRYGAIGITMCDEWRNSCDAFIEWSYEHGYREDLTIDRIDNSKGYSPGNCRWATYKEQVLNRKPTHWITIDGVTKCISDWAEEKGLSRPTVTWRWRQGIRGEDLFLPPHSHKIRERNK